MENPEDLENQENPEDLGIHCFMSGLGNPDPLLPRA